MLLKIVLYLISNDDTFDPIFTFFPILFNDVLKKILPIFLISGQLNPSGSAVNLQQLENMQAASVIFGILMEEIFSSYLQ